MLEQLLGSFNSNIWKAEAPSQLGPYHLREKANGIEIIGFFGVHGWALMGHGQIWTPSKIALQFWFGPRVISADEQYHFQKLVIPTTVIPK